MPDINQTARHPQHIWSLITTVFSALLLVWFTLFFQYSFNYQIQLSHYWILCFLLVIVMIMSSMIILNWRDIRWTGIPLLLTSCVALSVFLFSTQYSIANEHFAAYLLLYLTGLALWMTISTNGIYTILLLFTLNYIFQIGLGIYQLMTLATGRPDGWLLVTGTLENSGIYCCYLTCSLPFVHHLLFHRLRLALRQFIFWTLVTLTAIIVCYCSSRTAILAASVFPLIKYKKHLLTFLFIGAGIAVIFLAIRSKQYSSIGRMLCWTVTAGHLKEHFWLGTGLGRFTWYYPQWQAAYFSDNRTSPPGFITSAGETYIAFNEYLQLLAETGIAGFLAFSAVIFKFFQIRTTPSDPALIKAARTTAGAILVVGFTSYPFHSTVFLFLFLLCLVIVFKGASGIPRAPRQPRRTLQLSVACLFIGVSAYTILFAFERTEKALLLAEHLKEGDTGLKEEFRRDYAEFRHDGKFLSLYARYLTDQQEDPGTISNLYEEALHYFINKELMASCADAERFAGHYSQAKEHYAWLSNYLPSQFTPRFQLLQLYRQLGEKKNMMRLAQQIDSMPVKIPSFEINEIKIQTKIILGNIDATNTENEK